MIAAHVRRPERSRRACSASSSEIEAARKRGRELWGQVGCFPLGMEFTLRHPYPLEAFIAWRPAIEAEGSRRVTARVLADPAFRAAVKAESGQPRRAEPLLRSQLEHMTIEEVQRPEHAELVGPDVGAARARAAARIRSTGFLDFGLDGELDAMFDCKLFNTDENEVRELLRHPHAAIALSDAGAHLSFLCDAGFGLHLFGHWVRERGDLTLEQAVRAVTSAVGRRSTASRIAAGSRPAPGPT